MGMTEMVVKEENLLGPVQSRGLMAIRILGQMAWEDRPQTVWEPVPGEAGSEVEAVPVMRTVPVAGGGSVARGGSRTDNCAPVGTQNPDGNWDGQVIIVFNTNPNSCS